MYTPLFVKQYKETVQAHRDTEIMTLMACMNC